MMPLMSAASVWSNLENTVADKCLFKNITILLLVQVISCVFNSGELSLVQHEGRFMPSFWMCICPVPSLWPSAWRKVNDLLPPLCSSGLRRTMKSHRSVCARLSHISGSIMNDFNIQPFPTEFEG